jgi:hypothetical protein
MLKLSSSVDFLKAEGITPFFLQLDHYPATSFGRA